MVAYLLAVESDSFCNPELVETINKMFVPIRFNDTLKGAATDNSKTKEFIQKYAVAVFPSIIIALPDGTYFSEVSGAIKHKALQQQLNATIKTIKAVQGAETFARGDFESTNRLLNEYLTENKFERVDDREETFWPFESAFRRYISLKILGKDSEAQTCLTEALKHDNDISDWPIPLLRYIAGKNSLKDLEKEDEPNLEPDLALLAFANHKNQECFEYLEKALPRTIYKTRYDFRAAHAIVEKLPPISKSNSSQSTSLS